MKATLILLAVVVTVSGFRVAPKTNAEVFVDRESDKPKFIAVVRNVFVFGIHRHACSAALIDPEWVLAPAKCVKELPIFSSLEVVVGGKGFTTKEIVPHPNAVDINNDIALIRLSSPVAYSASVRPINLPFINAKHRGSATLYRRDSTGMYQSSTIRISDDSSACSHAPTSLGAGVLCAGDTETSAVQGDEGSPLTVSDRLGSQVLIGLVSFAKSEPAPVVFTQISAYTSWILDTLMKAEI